MSAARAGRPLATRAALAGRHRGVRAPASGHADRGSASVWLLAVGLVLVTAGLLGAAVGAAHVASHRAQSAADLGALAGAVRAIEGTAAACARAAEFVMANGARLTRCQLDGLDLTITVEVPAPAAGPGLAATATARAGPVRADNLR